MGILSVAAAFATKKKDESNSASGVQFDALYEAHFSFVWRSLRGLGIPTSAIDDVAQEVFIVVYRKLDTISDPSGIKSWLFSIARRVASDHRRSAQRKGTAVEFNEISAADEGPTPHAQIESRQLLQKVEFFLDTLTEENRSLFVLSEIEQLPVSEIAPMMDINPNTIYSRLKTIKQDLSIYMTRQSKWKK